MDEAASGVTWWQLNHLAVWEVVLLGAAAGLVGALALMHRRIFFAEAVSHATFPGAVLGVVAAAAIAPGYTSPLLFAGALTGCLLLAAAMAALVRVPGITSQSAAGIVLSAGFGLGYFAATWFRPLPVKVESFLTGSVLTVNAVDVAFAAVVLGAAVATCAWAGPRLVALGFSGDLFEASIGARRTYDAAVLGLISACIVVAIPAVGTIVSIALLAAPPAILRPWVCSPCALLAGSPVVGVVLGGLGLFSAHAWGLSASGMIAVWSGLAYACSAVARRCA